MIFFIRNTVVQKELSTQDKKESFSDPIKFKILAAKIFLGKILTVVPLDSQIDESFDSELNIESFLFFTISAVDILYHKINKKLNLNIPESQVNTKNLKEELEKLGNKESKQVLDIINCYIEEPKHSEKSISKETYLDKFAETHKDDSMIMEFYSRFENRKGQYFEHFWDRTKSSLWELRTLRNQITHGSMLKGSGVRGTVEPSDYYMVNLKRNDATVRDNYHISNPHQYFSESLKNVEELISKIQSIL